MFLLVGACDFLPGTDDDTGGGGGDPGGTEQRTTLETIEIQRELPDAWLVWDPDRVGDIQLSTSLYRRPDNTGTGTEILTALETPISVQSRKITVGTEVHASGTLRVAPDLHPMSVTPGMLYLERIEFSTQGRGMASEPIQRHAWRYWSAPSGTRTALTADEWEARTAVRSAVASPDGVFEYLGGGVDAVWASGPATNAEPVVRPDDPVNPDGPTEEDED